MKKRSLIILFFILIAGAQSIFAQCAVCGAAVQSSINDGQKIASGLNKGIIYLMIFPYLFLFLVGYLLYKYNKKASAEQ